MAGCLQALRVQTFRDFQVILVNSSQGDRTPAIVGEGFPEVELIESPTRLLPHAARNQGVTRATGEVLVFTDPDCRGRPDWLAWIAAACDAGHHVVGGPILPSLAATRRERGIHIAKFHMAMGVSPGAGGPGPGVPRRDLPTANACYTRTAWTAVGPFPAEYMCGDSLLAQRAHNRGYGVWFEPRAIVEHVGSGDVPGFVRERYRRGREYGRAVWALGGRSRGQAVVDVLATPARVLSALVRVGRHSVEANQGRHFVETLPLQVVAHAAWCAGEAAARVGQAIGRGGRPPRTG